MTKTSILCASTFLSLSVVLTSAAPAQSAGPRVAKVAVNQPVTLVDDGDSWTMDNGIVKMTVLKRNGNLSSLVYHGVEVLTRGEYWEQVPTGTITAKVTIDPRATAASAQRSPCWA